MFFRSLGRTEESHIGFRPYGLAVADFSTGGTFVGLLDPSEAGYPSMAEGGSALVDQLIDSIESIPGVISVSAASGFPLDRRRAYISVDPEGETRPDSIGMRAEYTLASEGYFSTIGTPIL